MASYLSRTFYWGGGGGGWHTHFGKFCPNPGSLKFSPSKEASKMPSGLSFSQMEVGVYDIVSGIDVLISKTNQPTNQPNKQ